MQILCQTRDHFIDRIHGIYGTRVGEVTNIICLGLKEAE